MSNESLVLLTAQAAELAQRLDPVKQEYDRLSAELAAIVSEIAAATAPSDSRDGIYDKAAVLEALRESPESSAGGIRNSLDADRSTTDAINKTLAALHREGKVKTVAGARGRYKKYVAV